MQPGPKRSPPFSVVINNFNYGRFLGQAIESAVRQGTDLCEVIVVDDGSTDGSRDVIESFAAPITKVLKENGGQGSACNLGFRHACGEWVIFLDADDFLLPDALRALMRELRAGHSKITWQMVRVDAEGRATEALQPPQAPDAPDPDHIATHGPMSFSYSPMSGNAWHRSFLEAVLPCSEARFPDTVDGYLAHLAPFFGKTRVIDRPISAYRLHESNMYATRSAFENRDLIRDRYEALSDVVEEQIRKNGLKCDPGNWKNDYWILLDEFEKIVTGIVPPGKDLILVDDQSLNAGPRLFGRRRRYLLERDGQFGGLPASGSEAVEQIKRMTRENARYVVFFPHAFWWLDVYPELGEFLGREGVLLHKGVSAIVFGLTSDNGSRP